MATLRQSQFSRVHRSTGNNWLTFGDISVGTARNDLPCQAIAGNERKIDMADGFFASQPPELRARADAGERSLDKNFAGVEFTDLKTADLHFIGVRENDGPSF